MILKDANGNLYETNQALETIEKEGALSSHLMRYKLILYRMLSLHCLDTSEALNLSLLICHFWDIFIAFISFH